MLSAHLLPQLAFRRSGLCLRAQATPYWCTYSAPLSHKGSGNSSNLKQKKPTGWIPLFRSLEPLQAIALEPAARKALVASFGTF